MSTARVAIFFLFAIALTGELRAATCDVRGPVEAVFVEDQRAVPKASDAKPEIATRRFDRKFAPLYRTVTEGKVRFSASQMLGDLWKLYPDAVAAGECSGQLARLLYIASYVELLRGYQRQGMTFGEAASAIDAEAHVLSVDDAFHLHYYLADMGARELAQPQVGLRHMLEAQRLAPAVATLDPSRRFGVRESVGYWYHESGKYREAREHNAALLADAERALGADNVELLSVLENLGQNTYSLHDLDAARGYMERTLALARRWMQQRIDRVAQPDGHGDLRKAAADSLAELEQRIREGR